LLDGGYKDVHAFCGDLSLCASGHAVFHEGQWWNVHCFADAEDAEKFMRQFGGEKFDPKQRRRILTAPPSRRALGLSIFDTLQHQHHAQRHGNVGRIGAGGSFIELRGDVTPCCPVPPIVSSRLFSS
jgi:hypothetical protein